MLSKNKKAILQGIISDIQDLRYLSSCIVSSAISLVISQLLQQGKTPTCVKIAPQFAVRLERERQMLFPEQGQLERKFGIYAPLTEFYDRSLTLHPIPMEIDTTLADTPGFLLVCA
jgi:hypothetical protein